MKVKLSVSASSVRESGLHEVTRMLLSYKENENTHKQEYYPAAIPSLTSG